MAWVLRKKTHNKKRLYSVTIAIVLLAAAGAALYKIPPSLLNIGSIFRPAADKHASKSAGCMSAEAVLRGTVFDRNLNELAVSYQLYSLFVRPSELIDRQATVSALSGITGVDEGELEVRLRTGGSFNKVAENLELQQALEINKLELSGVHTKLVEERFYPEHKVAADLVGYIGEGVGLAGIEGAYDTVLQHGDFQSSSLPEIDFNDSKVIGGSKLDLILTIDLEVQKEVERNLREYLKSINAEKGMALVMNTRTGAILSWARRPTFNPNYFWNKPNASKDSRFDEMVDADLYREIVARAAAVRSKGELGDKLPPVTVAAVDYGLREKEVRQYSRVLGLGGETSDRLPIDSLSKVRSWERGDVQVMQLLVGLSGLLNGGWKVRPHVIDAIYDEAGLVRYERDDEFDRAKRQRIMSPAMGIMMRMNMHDLQQKQSKNVFMYRGSVAKVEQEGALSRYVMQDIMIGAMPAKSPEYILLMVAGRDNLFPQQKPMQDDSYVFNIGLKILSETCRLAKIDSPKGTPVGHDSSNYNQFLISRRIDYKEEHQVAAHGEPVMPLLTGLSLRRGLQRLNPYNLKVRVEGSGRIITQHPESGKPLDGIGECTLVLESNI